MVTTTVTFTRPNTSINFWGDLADPQDYPNGTEESNLFDYHNLFFDSILDSSAGETTTLTDPTELTRKFVLVCSEDKMVEIEHHFATDPKLADIRAKINKYSEDNGISVEFVTS